ncbi:ELF3-like protein 2 [Mercurialis annua]|uniref:ELF3-like protein 2 n=1 Tax=Mercurialis annua TaxID=3986 RepID=UPI0021604F48|nr:ELF3-like protein 2 [Mercurialis annua]
MVRGAKDEDKLMSPMFPRLHVKDTDRGGARAPSRNKMALCEQLTQRVSSGSMSSSHVGGYERSVFNSSAPSNSDKSFSHSSGGYKLSSKRTSQERRSMNCTDGQSLHTRQILSSSAECNLFQSHNFSNSKKFARKETSDCTNSSKYTKDSVNRPFWNLSFSMHFQNVSHKQKKGTGSTDLSPRESIRNQNEEHIKISEVCHDPRERSAPVPLIQDKASADMSCSLRTESLKRPHPSSYQEYRSSLLDVVKSLHGTNACVDQDCIAMQDKIVRKNQLSVESAEGIDKENASEGRSESNLRSSLVDDNRSCNMIENVSENLEDKRNESLQVGDNKRDEDPSKTSVAYSLSGSDISPGDVVRIIGEKQFCKTRAAIVNQQRAFTIQLYELHRLIKVQQLIAASPELLLDHRIYLGKSSLKTSQAKRVPMDNAVEQPPIIFRQKDSSQKPYASTEFADENAVSKLPLPSVDSEAGKGLHTQQSSYESHSGGALPAAVAANVETSKWCFPPPGNQWLVPVMSPSEGLVYKPYTGPCPPAAGFLAPVFGNCSPISLTGAGEDFMNAAYGVPASHQQEFGIIASNPSIDRTYFPPYGTPVMTPSFSGSAVKQVSPFLGSHSEDDRLLSVGDFNFRFPQKSSRNTPSSPMTRVMLCNVEKFQALKESELPGSTVSSPSALPLFPMEPTVQESDQCSQTHERRTHVIKVIPHNPRSATESAARIFQSIQEERKQYDYM